MVKSRLDYGIYQHSGQMVLGFHGCDKSVGEKILRSQTEHLLHSNNDYDWLGDGIYFWLNDPVRAYEWAEHSDKVEEPFVIGAIIELGNCLNLSERSAIQALQKSYEELKRDLMLDGKEINKEYVNKISDDGGFKLKRWLDCLVINNLMIPVNTDSSSPGGNDGNAPRVVFDTVYGYFQEGKDAFPGAGIKEKSHVQICVRNTDCIKGYFLPREIADM